MGAEALVVESENARTCGKVWPEAAGWGVPIQCKLPAGHKGEHQHGEWYWGKR